MSDTTQNNAMAEIALALAMGFFSIMVLTMVSMGSAMVSQNTPALDQDPIHLAQNAQNQKDTARASTQNKEQVKPENMIIAYQGAFLDARLNPIDPNSLSPQDPLVLAVHPNSSMDETMTARNQIRHENLRVVILNDDWITALETTQ